MAEEETCLVSTTTDPEKLARRIAMNHGEGKLTVLSMVGAASTFIAVQALLHANEILFNRSGARLLALPFYAQLTDAPADWQGPGRPLRLRLLED